MIFCARERNLSAYCRSTLFLFVHGGLAVHKYRRKASSPPESEAVHFLPGHHKKRPNEKVFFYGARERT